MLLFIVTAAFLFGLGIKLGLVQMQLTLGPGPEGQKMEQHHRSMPPSDAPWRSDDTRVVYSKNK